ncbi:hypothetical protein CC80DRAFT_142490 [Byssothecium circinans]|uniref:Uncharacterized protein n=1 Tax=Byssothecium circinans TaxID=147558 RepID=A0A6A5TXD6_9PLEO|nr:hypothetical protein CC80DRAFT_142490 [Byssothecium circinans]
MWQQTAQTIMYKGRCGCEHSTSTSTAIPGKQCVTSPSIAGWTELGWAAPMHRTAPGWLHMPGPSRLSDSRISPPVLCGLCWLCTLLALLALALSALLRSLHRGGLTSASWPAAAGRRRSSRSRWPSSWWWAACGRRGWTVSRAWGRRSRTWTRCGGALVALAMTASSRTFGIPAWGGQGEHRRRRAACRWVAEYCRWESWAGANWRRASCSRAKGTKKTGGLSASSL